MPYKSEKPIKWERLSHSIHYEIEFKPQGTDADMNWVKHYTVYSGHYLPWYYYPMAEEELELVRPEMTSKTPGSSRCTPIGEL